MTGCPGCAILDSQGWRAKTRPFNSGCAKGTAKHLEGHDHRARHLFAPKRSHERRGCSNMYSLRQRLPAATLQTLLVKHHVEQRTVDLQAPVVVDEAELPEAIHKEVNSGSSGTNHLRQCFLTYPGNHIFGSPFLSKASEHQ